MVLIEALKVVGAILVPLILFFLLFTFVLYLRQLGSSAEFWLQLFNIIIIIGGCMTALAAICTCIGYLVDFTFQLDYVLAKTGAIVGFALGWMIGKRGHSRFTL
jgi:hypothetical protein